MLFDSSNSFSKSWRASSSVAMSTPKAIHPSVASTDSTSPVTPIQNPAWASPRFLGVSPASTFFTPLRPSTTAAIEHPTDTIDESPAVNRSRVTETRESTKPATAGLLSGTCCWG